MLKVWTSKLGTLSYIIEKENPRSSEDEWRTRSKDSIVSSQEK